MKTIYVKPKNMVKKWFIIDAEGKRLGKVAVEAAKILRGKNKPEFAPLHDLGDYVIIVNAEKAALTGGKENKKVYYRHSGYPGGLTAEVYSDIIKRKPTFPMENAVRGMLPKGRLGRQLFTNMKVYAGADHPHSAQKPETVNIKGQE
ncbi:MAG: 50S ribosomal protein L13 [Spirochaetales bacterium]|nr:50S ribosomal protein L13 [Spirochaetales bacterium]